MVSMRISELKLEIFGGDGRMHAVGDRIVKFVKHGIDTNCLQFGIASIIPLDEVFCLSALDGMDKDGIEIMIVQQKDVVHAACEDEGEPTWLILRDHGVEFVKFN